MKKPHLLGCIPLVYALLGSIVTPSAYAVLTLEQAVNTAIANDPWIDGNLLMQKSLNAQSKAVDTQPDPVLSLGLVNLPTDGFAFSQEAMTQLKLGVAQRFRRGDSGAIQQKQLQQLAAQYPLQREDRKAKVAVTVSQLWLDAYMADQSIKLIESEQDLFSKLADIVQASYSSAQGKTRQQDVVRAQLEISRVEDRLTVFKSQRDFAVAKLFEWLGTDNSYYETTSFELEIADEMPNTKAVALERSALLNSNSRQQLANLLAGHPLVRALEQRIQASFSGVELARQKYRPQWGVNAAYGYRDDDQFGNSRADFLSLGVTVDLPLFTADRQDKELEASQLSAESIKTEKRLLLRNMLAQLDGLYRKYLRQDERIALYNNAISQQLHEQAEAALTAYTSDDGDFAEVMRARIAELNGRIELIAIAVERVKTLQHIDYFFVHDKPQPFLDKRVKP